VPGSLTRRQLLIRTGGASVALACLGALPTAGAVADPAALTAARGATYAALLDALDASPGYELADRATRVDRFATIYAGADDRFRAYADEVLDDFEADGFNAAALDLAALPYLEDNDSHTFAFTV
jgi:hypothetical protein